MRWFRIISTALMRSGASSPIHASRLPRGAGDAHECWLERYYQQGIEQGGRVRERLSVGVKEALEILGTGPTGSS
jgi:hypothetical protein